MKSSDIYHIFVNVIQLQGPIDINSFDRRRVFYTHIYTTKETIDIKRSWPNEKENKSLHLIFTKIILSVSKIVWRLMILDLLLWLYVCYRGMWSSCLHYGKEISFIVHRSKLISSILWRQRRPWWHKRKVEDTISAKRR